MTERPYLDKDWKPMPVNPDALRDAIVNWFEQELTHAAFESKTDDEFADAITALPEMQARERVIEAARAWAKPNHPAGHFDCIDALHAAVANLDGLLDESGEEAT